MVQVIGRKIVLYKPNPDFKKRKYETSKAELEKQTKGTKRAGHKQEIADAKNAARSSGFSLRFVEEDDEEFDNEFDGE